MRSLVILFFIFGLCFFVACSSKKPAQSRTLSLSINSPLIKFSEQGFLYEDKTSLKLEVYKLGQIFFALNIRDKICINQVCYEKKVFNEKFFKFTHYEDLMQDILKFQPIYEGKNVIQNECGFIQEIQASNFNILYEVCENRLEFKDLLNHLFVKIKK
ncbi:hypothetical protein DMB92_00700 [Campylobacter sp. MIT 99-7217]|nr:hypothetical protein DMB92_00700 [Campylobacter sp. MIT 99-7217]